jgi:hypothetical protein
MGPPHMKRTYSPAHGMVTVFGGFFTGNSEPDGRNGDG